MLRIFFVAILCLMSIGANAQTSPNLTFGQVLTPAQWNSLFAGKEDVLGFTPLNLSGGVMSGRLVTAAPSSTTSGFNTTPGTAPASPVNGDWWVTTAGAFVQVNGVTIGPIGGATSSSFAATSPITLSFPSGVVTYACATCGVTGSPLSQFAATTSALFLGVISDETGTGLVMGNNGPTMIAPILGAATATSINKVAITAPATSATLTIANGKTLTASNSLTFTGTDATSFAFPGTNDTVVTLGATQTLTAKTLTSPTINAGALSGTFSGSATFSGTINYTGPFQIGGTAQTFPTSGLLVGTTDTQTLTNKTITSSTDVLGGVTMTLGSDANGDLYCRSGGVLTRIAGGASASLLTSGGATVCPTWVAAPGGGNVSNTGTPTVNQIAQWTNATTVQGVNFASLLVAPASSDLTITGTTSLSISQNFDSAFVASNSSLSTTIAATTMMGWGSAGGGACHLTPKYSGRVWAQISGTMSEVGGGGLSLIAHWGTGTAPNNAAASTGTSIGNTAGVNAGGSTAVSAPFTIGGVINVGSTGTAVWIDGFVASATGASLVGVSCSMHEIL